MQIENLARAQQLRLEYIVLDKNDLFNKAPTVADDFARAVGKATNTGTMKREREKYLKPRSLKQMQNHAQ